MTRPSLSPLEKLKDLFNAKVRLAIAILSAATGWALVHKSQNHSALNGEKPGAMSPHKSELTI
jgi:hypothetical protein